MDGAPHVQERVASALLRARGARARSRSVLVPNGPFFFMDDAGDTIVTPGVAEDDEAAKLEVQRLLCVQRPHPRVLK